MIDTGVMIDYFGAVWAATDKSPAAMDAALELYEAIMGHYAGHSHYSRDRLTGRAGYGIIQDSEEEDIIFRTSDGGKVYAINAKTGEIAGGLGLELEGAAIGK